MRVPQQQSALTHHSLAPHLPVIKSSKMKANPSDSQTGLHLGFPFLQASQPDQSTRLTSLLAEHDKLTERTVYSSEGMQFGQNKEHDKRTYFGKVTVAAVRSSGRSWHDCGCLHSQIDVCVTVTQQNELLGCENKRHMIAGKQVTRLRSC